VLRISRVNGVGEPLSHDQENPQYKRFRDCRGGFDAYRVFSYADGTKPAPTQVFRVDQCRGGFDFYCVSSYPDVTQPASTDVFSVEWENERDFHDHSCARSLVF